MKKCTSCLEVKALDEFQVRSRNKDGRTNMCKPCKREYDNAHYKAHPERRKYIRDNSDKRVRLVREWLVGFFREHPCVDCGETRLVLLQFDHVDGKTANMSLLQKRASLKTVQEEIARCQVRCVSCHTIKTAIDFNWWQLKYEQ